VLTLSLAASVVLGAAPSVFLLVFFYLKDRYEPEPRGHVALAFAKGALAVLPAWVAQVGCARAVGRDWLVLGGVWARLFEAVVMAGAVEEGAKWVIFLALIYWWEEFDEPLDGVVYGVALALGFATVENVLCVVRDGLAVGALRALFAVPAHALFGATMGFYLGRAKLGRGRALPDGRYVTQAQKLRRLALALLVPVAFHAAYDFTLVELRGLWIYAVIGALSIALWAFVLRRVHTATADSPFRVARDEVK
jgi:RsiW-degrading membrane proteinase PrsW (M82 family)